MKKLLILSSRIMSEEIISYAKSLGVYTIVADNYPPEKSPAKLIADEAWDISLEEMDELERMCREHNVTGSICGLSEYALEKCMELKDGNFFWCSNTWWGVNDGAANTLANWEYLGYAFSLKNGHCITPMVGAIHSWKFDQDVDIAAGFYYSIKSWNIYLWGNDFLKDHPRLVVGIDFAL